MSVPNTMAALSLVAFVLWSYVFWSVREELRTHRAMPYFARDATIIALLVTLGGLTITNGLHGKELAGLVDMVAMMSRTATVAAAAYVVVGLHSRPDGERVD